jgi:hypothetical protein
MDESNRARVAKLAGVRYRDLFGRNFERLLEAWLSSCGRCGAPIHACKPVSPERLGRRLYSLRGQAAMQKYVAEEGPLEMVAAVRELLSDFLLWVQRTPMDDERWDLVAAKIEMQWDCLGVCRLAFQVLHPDVWRRLA